MACKSCKNAYVENVVKMVETADGITEESSALKVKKQGVGKFLLLLPFKAAGFGIITPVALVLTNALCAWVVFKWLFIGSEGLNLTWLTKPFRSKKQ